MKTGHSEEKEVLGDRVPPDAKASNGGSLDRKCFLFLEISSGTDFCEFVSAQVAFLKNVLNISALK
jgi:hypothetical protein